MTNPTVGRPHLAFVLFLGLVAAAVGLTGLPIADRYQWNLVTALSQTRIGEGRLFRSSENSDPALYQRALRDSGLALLKGPDAPLHSRIRALINANAGNLGGSASSLRQLVEDYPDDPEVLNDLGVIYMALGQENASNYFRAVHLFERSRRLTLHAAAPNFNVAAVYRRLELDELVDERLVEYLGAESDRGVSNDAESESKLLDLMHRALVANNLNLANQLLQANLRAYRHIALHSALDPRDGSTVDGAIEFILEYFEKAGDDATIGAIRRALHGPNRERVINARKHVSSGIDAFQRTKFEEASHLYDLAETALAGANSPFDDLWIKLNRADTDIHLGHRANAQGLLATVIEESRRRRYTWLLGLALTVKSSDPTLARNNEEQLQTLNEAAAMLIRIDATQDSTRALNYLATAYFFAGDVEKSLDVAYRTLSFTAKSDHLRRAQLFLMVGIEVHRLGFEEYASTFVEKALLEAKGANNPTLVSFISSNLAMLHAAKRDFPSAKTYFTLAKTLSSQVESRRDRDLGELSINLLCARIGVDSGNLSEAEKCLQRNMEILLKLPGNIPYFFVQTLLQLGETHALQGRFAETHRNLQQAADLLETDDAYLRVAGLRMSFENERRSFYEKALTFEYDHGSKDAAWEYTQRYRSKLFLEFLGQLNPGVTSIRGVAIDRSKAQQLIPPNVQVVEYVVLKDRLLIWLVSNNAFASTTVPVTRAQLERKVADFLRRTQDKSKDEFQRQAQDLHRFLIEPIDSQLQPGKTLAIIPDQVLHRLNFPALYSHSKKSFLIERHPIIENPSLTSLLSDTNTVPSRINAVAFGAQTDDTNATAELAAMQRYYAGIQTFNGPTALKTAFLRSVENAGIFHFAGHSQDASDPLRSAILLDGNKEGPNSVSAVDITKHRMPPNSVVVLASCDSSVGNSRDGIGMRGLTSAFLISGAGSVVGSLWLVEAGSTSRLVLAFHKSFAQDKLPVAEALRKAQMQFIADGIHPYYWSGFVVTGNVSALR
jgi:CHAT domain-containing protein